jgi:hypothetical protein
MRIPKLKEPADFESSSKQPIVYIPHFVEAVRDAGYLSTASAISELVDNSIQANATSITIRIQINDGKPTLDVIDDGDGMDTQTLSRALQFGGSSRFDSRDGLGRFGMGLPTSSLSQAKLVEVVSWQDKCSYIAQTHLDVQEILQSHAVSIPKLVLTPKVQLKDWPSTSSGTLVRWKNCDRFDFKRLSTIEKKLHAELGRRFREYLTSGVSIKVNDVSVSPNDPLFLNTGAQLSGATQYGPELVYRVLSRNTVSGKNRVGTIRVTFSELPVNSWRALSAQEKRANGISNGAGVSILRAGREIDMGWFFMGTKRKENYDDWWRCQVSFDSCLDEDFGVTHTKQGIRPRQNIRDILTPDIESTARILNTRARKAHTLVADSMPSKAEKIALINEPSLPPIKLIKRLNNTDAHKSARTFPSISISKLNHTHFMEMTTVNSNVSIQLNSEHPFFHQIYTKAIEDEKQGRPDFKHAVDLILLSFARSEATFAPDSSTTSRREINMWSDILATYLTQ